MSKYFLLFKQTLSQFSAYRLQIVFRVAQSFITPLLTVAALSRTSASSALITSLLPYYILVALISPLTISLVDDDLDDLTRSGDINNFLLKPFSLFKWLLVKEFSEKSLVFILLFPVFFIVALIYRLSLINLIALISSSLICFILSFSISYCVGLFCFWIDDFWAIHNVKFVVIQFFAGLVLPYTLFPHQLASLLKYSPFPYLVNWPARIIQNTASVEDFIIALFWVITIYGLSVILQKKAIVKYSFTAG